MSNPDKENFKWLIENPLKEPGLSDYLKEVNLWHGYIKYLGLPQLNDHADTPIQNLFVLPRLSKSWISADEPTENWPERNTPLQALKERDFTIVLGDPGGGKSTLINWLTWRLAGGKYPSELGPLVPLPIVLRDINLLEVTDWNTLITTFLKHPMCKHLAQNPDTLEKILSFGQALILIDGIDEVADLASREILRTAIFEGKSRYPKAKWLLTSRIVGYDELPFEDSNLPQTKKTKPVSNSSPDLKDVASPEKPTPGRESVLYVCPFDDSQISEFCSNWYAFRERSKSEAQTKAADLISALNEDRATLRLARTPNLLTMMALLHRVKARLPHGRTLLYEDIAHAYLHTIDDYRKLHIGENHPLPHKKRWLARAAWELQRKRSLETREGTILATKKELIEWFSDSMRDSGVLHPEESALHFIDYIAKRSGLLIPRSEDKFAFLHLSFQEYFSSIFILENLESSIFNKNTTTTLSPKSLKSWSSTPIWCEVIVFLFELGSLRAPHWPSWLIEKTFGKNFSEIYRLKSHAKSSALFDSLFKIISNPHIALSQEIKIQALQPLFTSAIRSFGYLEKSWLNLLEEEYQDIAVKEPIRALFWKAVWDSRPEFIELQSEDFPVISDLPAWENAKTLSIDSYDQDETNIGKIFPNVRDVYFFNPKKVMRPKNSILKDFSKLSQIYQLNIDELRSLPQEIRNNLSFIGIDTSLNDNYDPISLPNLIGIAISGETKNLRFIESASLIQLSFNKSTIKSLSGLELFPNVSHISFRLTSNIPFEKVFSTPNIKTLQLDMHEDITFPKPKGWTIKENGHSVTYSRKQPKKPLKRQAL